MLVLGHVDTQWVVASRTAGEVFFTVWTVLGSHAKEIAAVSVYKLKKKKKKVTSSRCRAGKKKKGTILEKILVKKSNTKARCKY